MRILVIEDDELVAEVLRVGLAEDGYLVEVATSGAEGKARASADTFDLIILDLLLPDATGHEVARHLRAQGSTVPILMLTARQEAAAVVQGLDAGADDYLTKPFDLTVLKARLRALLRRGAPAAPEQLVYGDVVMHRMRRRVEVRGKAVRLTPKEYALLEFLLRHPDQIRSRGDLLTQVWGIRFDPGSNLADVTIARLRAKLAGSRVQIAAVRGQGYLLTSADSAITDS